MSITVYLSPLHTCQQRRISINSAYTKQAVSNTYHMFKVLLHLILKAYYKLQVTTYNFSCNYIIVTLYTSSMKFLLAFYKNQSPKIHH